VIDNKDLLKILIEQDHKFEYAFATLSFGTLALSIQFSPNYGHTWAPLLVAAWTLFLVASLLAGYRIIYRIVGLKINYNRNKAEDYQSKMSTVAQQKRAVRFMQVIDSSGKQMSIEEIEQGLEKNMKNVSLGTELMESLDKRLSRLYWVQMGAFLGGLTCNFVFVSINYLCKANV